MKLPSMKYSDGITKGRQIRFGGLNHSPGAGDGELWDMKNLTSDHYPLLASRAPRRKWGTLSQPGGIFSWDGLCWVDGTTFYFQGEEKGQVAAGRKSFASMGAYILIFPDKCYYNVSTGVFGSLEASWTGTELTFGDGTLYGETAAANQMSCPGAAWGSLGFRAGDAVTIAGCTKQPGNNVSIIIREIDGDNLHFYENSFALGTEGSAYTETGTLSVKRTVPELKYLCENENRLWGCTDTTIYASKLGDVFNWNVYDGLDTDAYAVDTGSAGAFTGCVSYLGYLDDNNISRKPEQDNGTRETTGPPFERFSHEDQSSIKQQLVAASNALNGMDPVANITISANLLAMDKAQKQEWVINKLRPTGYSVNRRGLGLIEFAQKRLKSAFNYFRRNSAEEAVFEALPNVLRDGIEIGGHMDHKGRSYGTVTIAAPIIVNGARGNMAVVVKRTTGNYYKVHRVLSPDGAEFILETKEEAAPTSGGGVTNNGSLAAPISSASGDIITDRNSGVKERFSYAGENADNADLDALARAKEMQAAGVADETIRQQTGWHTGMDGKWRWEIDDSTAQYRPDGDARLLEEPGYQRLQELTEKWAENDGLLSTGEQLEMDRLQEEYTDRVWMEKYMLSDFLRHDELYKAYPEMKYASVVFADLPSGTNGSYDPRSNTITLSNTLLGSPEKTLLHEVQHMIQKKERFAGGSNTQHWDGVLENNDDIQSRGLMNAREELSRFENDPNNAEAIRLAGELREADIRADASAYNALWSQAEEAGIDDAINRYYDLQFDVDAQERKVNNMSSFELYYNTAGEIEARDVAQRREFNAQQRRETIPSRGDDRTVFAEKTGLSLDMDNQGETERIGKADIKAIRSIGRISVNQFSQADKRATERFARMYWRDIGAKSPFFRTWFGDWRGNDQTAVRVANQRGDSRGTCNNEDTGWNIQVSGKVFNETRSHYAEKNRSAQPYLLYIDDIVKKAILLDSFAMGSGKSANSLMMHSLYAVADNGSGPNLIKLYVEEMYDPNQRGTTKRAYQLQNIEVSSLTGDNNTESSGLALASFETADIRTIADLFAAVKSRDESFCPNPQSQIVNEDGSPKIVYHGTNQSFNTFESQNGAYWFSESEDYAESMMEERGGGEVKQAYLNMRNPYRATLDPGQFSDPSYETPILRRAKAEGYDGVIIENSSKDPLVADTFYVVFDPRQIKSATDNMGTFDGTNPDIRYSLDETEDTASTGAQEKISLLMNQYQEAAAAGNQERMNVLNGQLRRALGEASPRKKASPKKTGESSAKSKPIQSKRDLKNNVVNLFSIPAGQRAELGSVLDGYADRLLKNGVLTEEDRQHLFDRLYESGVMTVPADEYYAEGRSYLTSGRIYVPDSVVAELGDDWGDLRRRAFAAGVYLTRSQSIDGRSVAGIDVWNQDLARQVPGLFDENETDMRLALERIVQVAEEGKDEHLSLAEYTRRLSQQEGISEDEFLDNMERQLDWALRTFAEKAQLEVHLRDRTGRKIAQEREKGNQRMTRQQAKEAQRRADERQARKDSTRRAKERRELRELQQRTLKQLQWLSKNRNRAPEELRSAWDEVLGDIDLYAISAADETHWSEKHNATWKDLAQMYKDAMKNDSNFMPSKELERIVTRLDATKIADMDLGALQDLYKAAIGLRTEFYNRNNVINDEMQRLFAEVYTDAKQEIKNAPGRYTGKRLDKLFNLQQLTAMNVLQRMGGWDPNGAFFSMAKQLERGERDVRAYKVKASRILESFLTENADWVKTADGQGKDAVWYKIEIPELVALELGKKPEFGKTITVWVTPAQKVHMYLESKNVDNLRHMTGGRTFADKELYSQGKRTEAFAQGTTVRMAPETVKAIVSDLTPQELELARLLEQYYNSLATQEINRVSNALYGYDKAMGKNYAPIYTNRNYTKTEFGVFDTTAEGVDNLKGRQYAVNPSYNIGAFDAFEKHMDHTSRFVGMAIPTRNWKTLMNWQEKNNSTGDVITHKWGEEGKSYITDLITTLQEGGGSKSDVVQSGVEKLRNNYISAVFGANPSIVLKQLGSIPLAAAYLDAKNFPSVRQISGIDRQLINQYTQDLEWRTMGYSMPETKILKDNPNWTQSNKVANFLVGGGAITAMDGWAASVLWPWAENKVSREFPELSRGTDAQIRNGQSPFYQKVAEEFENAVARSQSTSDEIHQSTLRKSKNPFTQVFTMFRSDSAQTYNVLRQKIGEAQYYARTGADMKTIRAARKAVGVAATSALVGYVWAEAVELLMNLWKHKGKNYRDDDDELTAESIAKEMVSGLVGDIAGVVIGGEELYDFLGSLLTDGTPFGIETMGLEQLNDCAEAMWYAGCGLRDAISDGADILKNGGNPGEYFRRHGNEMLGGIKDIANTAAMYIFGFPAENLEKYLLGGIKWLAPELQARYEDLLNTPGKTDLSGLNGDALAARVGDIIDNRGITASEETAWALAQLYEAGEKTAFFSDTPDSISIDGEKRILSAYQQQTYDKVWTSIVSDGLDELVGTSTFAEAENGARAKMLSNLYAYAAERARAELFDDYEMDSGAAKNAAIVAAGVTVAECITWNTITSEMKSGEKSAELASWNIPESAKREIFRCKISESREDSIAAFDEAGLSFDQFLQAYSMYGQINNEDLKAGMKAVEFSHWVNAQDYTAKQAAVVKDELAYYGMTPVSSSRYDELVESGVDPNDAYNLTGALNELQPDDGADEVTDLQKWRASVDFSDDVEDQLAALSVVMTDAQFQKTEIANSFGINPDTYVAFLEIKPQYDADSNGSYTQKEIQTAVDGLPGYYTKEQKAVLWQLATGATSAKNNPYSRDVGQQVLDARAAAKEAAAQEQAEAPTDSTDDSFSQALLDQLLGRG